MNSKLLEDRGHISSLFHSEVMEKESQKKKKKKEKVKEQDTE